MDFRGEELAGARPWKLAAFTTYALSLSFFEAVVLDRLVRGRTEEALVLADAEGVRAALSEQGAQRAGRDYEVEPVVLGTGAFHAKLSVYDGGADDVHLVASSGNLTFSGWGRNLEIADHLHPSFAREAFSDAAAFFEGLAALGKAHAAAERCADIAARLARAAAAGRGDGSLRLLHGFGRPIGERIAELADALGGATRLAAAAPFWDGGQAALRLCTDLGLDRIHVHAHPRGVVHGDAGDCWPRSGAVEVVPVIASSFAADARVMHAKAFEIVCRDGRISVAGSANGTHAALYGGNVEACVARISRAPVAAWVLEPAIALPPFPEAEADGDMEDTDQRGILRAEVAGDAVTGRLLSPRLSGAALLSRVSADGVELLGDVTLAHDRSFSASVPGLEGRALRGGRLVLRIDADGGAAEGFASISAVTGLRRIAGKAASSLFAVLAGTDTPEDVRVLMEWAYDNASMLARTPAGSGGWSRPGGEAAQEDRRLAQGDLWNAALPGGAVHGQQQPGSEAGWMRFIDSLVSALRERRGPIGRDEGVDSDGGAPNRRKPSSGDDAATAAATVMDRVIEAMLPKGAAGVAGLRALDLAAYACDRLGDSVAPQRARDWLKKGLDAALSGEVPEDRADDLRAAALALSGTGPDADGARAARGRLLRAGTDFAGPPPADGWVRPFLDRMDEKGGLDRAWSAAASTMTWREQARSYALDLARGQAASAGEYEDLLAKAREEADLMRQAVGSEQARKRVKVLEGWSSTCCRMQLPRIEEAKLRQYGVARAANCCQKVLVWPEGANG